MGGALGGLHVACIQLAHGCLHVTVGVVAALLKEILPLHVSGWAGCTQRLACDLNAACAWLLCVVMVIELL